MPAADADVLGLAFAGRDRAVQRKVGHLAGWLPAVGSDCCDCTLLAGMESEFQALAKGARGLIALPGVRGVWPEQESPVTAIVTWDDKRQQFIIITVPDFTALQVETLIGSERRTRRLIEQQLEAANSEARFASLARTRLRLARDLHDTLVHSIVALLTQIRLVRHFVASSPDSVAGGLAVAEEAAISGLSRARDTIARLRMPDDLDARSDIEEMLARFAERSGIEVSSQLDDSLGDVLRPYETAIGRILGEALRNIEMHSAARHVEVRAVEAMTEAGRQILIDIRDDGRGFDPALVGADHFGLVGMAEFAELAGGTCSVESSIGHGTTVHIALPLPPSAASGPERSGSTRAAEH